MDMKYQCLHINNLITYTTLTYENAALISQEFL